MSDLRPWSPPEEPRTLFWVFTVLLLMMGALGVSLVLGSGESSPGPTGGPRDYQPAPLFPHSPVDTSNPAADPPPVTIIKDTRDYLHRLPLDRNTPKGWTLPKPKPQTPT